jgi:PleD family two-component response regulator
MPVVVVSGSDEQQERERAKEAGATDLITKGIGTAQLLSRLDILSKLVSTQYEYEQSLEALVQGNSTGTQLASPYDLQTQAEAMLTYAIRHSKNFVLFNMCVGLKRNAAAGHPMPVLSASIVNAIGQLLHGTVRQTDSVAKTGDAEFTLVSGSINFESARNFAERLCRAIANASLAKEEQMLLIASCGLVSLYEFNGNGAVPAPTLNALWDIARQRALLGLRQGISGVVSASEEADFLQRTGPQRQ